MLMAPREPLRRPHRRLTFAAALRQTFVAMMTDWERERFSCEAATLAAEMLARGAAIRPALSPLFHRTIHQHPDEEDRLLELWDKLSSRPVL
jgi:hypothetical protein